MATHYWLLVDAVRISDAAQLIQEHFSIQQILPLYAGTPFDYLLEQSPYLVNMGADIANVETWRTLSYFDTSSVIFAVDDKTCADDFITHLQSMLKIEVAGQVLCLRFQSQRFWDAVLAQANMDDITQCLGPSKGVCWFNSDDVPVCLYKPNPFMPVEGEQHDSVFKQWV